MPRKHCITSTYADCLYIMSHVSLNFRRSLGLVIPPRIRFLQRMQKKISAKSADSSKQQNSEHDSDQSDISDINNENKKTFDGRKIEEKDIAAIQFSKQI